MAFGKTSISPFTSVKKHPVYSISSFGSQFVVLNKGSTTLTTQGPYQQFGGQTALDANTYVVTVPRNAARLDLYHLYPGVANPSTALKVKAFGWVGGEGDYDHTTHATLPGVVDAARFNPLTSLVIPLEEYGTANLEVTFPNTPAVTMTATGASLPANVAHIGNFLPSVGAPLTAFAMSERKSYATVGVDAITIAVSQAAAGMSAAGMVIGRFVS